MITKSENAKMPACRRQAKYNEAKNKVRAKPNEAKNEVRAKLWRSLDKQ